MTKEYRITTQNVTPTSEGDCHLEADDPIHELMTSATMGGLGAQQRIAEYNLKTAQKNITRIEQQRTDAQARGIKPGTPAWFAMFPKH